MEGVLARLALSVHYPAVQGLDILKLKSPHDFEQTPLYTVSFMLQKVIVAYSGNELYGKTSIC